MLDKNFRFNIKKIKMDGDWYSYTIKKCKPSTTRKQVNYACSQYEYNLSSLTKRTCAKCEYHYENVPKLNGSQNTHVHACLKVIPGTKVFFKQKKGYSIWLERLHTESDVKKWLRYIRKNDQTKDEVLNEVDSNLYVPTDSDYEEYDQWYNTHHVPEELIFDAPNYAEYIKE